MRVLSVKGVNVMLRFFKSNYTDNEISMLRYLIRAAAEKLQIESDCKSADCMECRKCAYSELCADLERLSAYLKTIERKGIK